MYDFVKMTIDKVNSHSTPSDPFYSLCVKSNTKAFWSLTDILFDCDSYKNTMYKNVYHISLSFLFLNDYSANVQKKNFHLILIDFKKYSTVNRINRSSQNYAAYPTNFKVVY